MVKVGTVGFIEELEPEERDYIKNNLGEWKEIPVERFMKVLKSVGKEDWAGIVEEKSKAYGFDKVKYTKVKTDKTLYEVFNDSKNTIVVKSPIKKKKSKTEVKVNDVAPQEKEKANTTGKRKSGSRRGKKKEQILEYAAKFLEKKGGEFTIGDFMTYLKEHGLSVYRPQVYQIITKNCEFEYRTEGKRKVIYVKGLKV